MRIIYLISKAVQSGPVNQALNILKGMKMNGRVIATLVTIDAEDVNNSWLQRFLDADINIVQLNPNGIYSFMQCRNLLKDYIIDNKIDLIHSSGYRVNLLAMFMRKYVSIVSTQRSHPQNIAELESPFTRKIKEFIYLRIIKKLDCLVACSKSLQQEFKYDYGMQIEVVQNGVDVDFFYPSSLDEKATLRKKLNLPKSKVLYLVLGILEPRKNVSLVIKAAKLLKSNNICFIIVGTGKEEEMLKESIKKTDNVIFVGHTSTPIDYLKACDCLLSTSLAEGLPNTVLEGLSCGLPCILSDIEPHRELIEGTQAGVLFMNNNVDDLIDKLIQSMKWNISEKGQKARSLVENNFSLKLLSNKYEEIYKKVKNKH